MTESHETSEQTTVPPPRVTAVENENELVPFLEPQTPARMRELLGVLAVVVLGDALLYRGQGFAGTAVFFVGVLPLLWLGRPKDVPAARPVATAVWTLLVLLASARLVWLGNSWVCAAAFVLLAGWTLAIQGRWPYVLDTVAHSMFAPLAGLFAGEAYRHVLRPGRPHTVTSDESAHRSAAGSWKLPLATVLAFGTIFVLANPDVTTVVNEFLSNLSSHLADWVSTLMPDVSEIVVWFAIAAVTIGLLRPFSKSSPLDALADTEDAQRRLPKEPALSDVYLSFRNTLVAVTVLFAIYLVFEFLTLGRRDFPKGFYYAGYAHAGAAWLTVALAIASGLLSAMFRGSMLTDPKLPSLKKLAWVWSLENFLLAAAVVNRLLIYVDFNGMTRMRVVGFLGVAAVVGGFVLVVIKIARGKGFVWLIRGDLWVLSAAVLTLILLPVDRLVHAYNVRQILSGHLAPSVQISHHPLDVGGLISLLPLLECEDEVIREGVTAMLFEQMNASKAQIRKADKRGWTAYQNADQRFVRKCLEEANSTWPKGEWPEWVRTSREDKQRQFRGYSHQWW